MAAHADSLRTHLRSATHDAHDRLDRAMRPASDWRSHADYARFLAAQYASRLPVERWLAIHAPEDLNPPAQTALIAGDLASLGYSVPATRREFEVADIQPGTALGVAWVLAGSSLGNRAMLRDMQIAQQDSAPAKVANAGAEAWPHEFLASRAMTQFWKKLRPQIEADAPTPAREAAIRAADAVFDHFLAHAPALEVEISDLERPERAGPELEVAL